jgi:hypothetical protein
MRKILGLVLIVLFASVSAARAQLGSTPQGAISQASFANQTNSPVWVTIYTAKLGILGPWTIAKASCVTGQSTGGWNFTGEPYVKIQAEAQTGHGALCNTGTYWKGSISSTAMSGDYGQNMSVKFQSLPGGGSKLSYW